MTNDMLGKLARMMALNEHPLLVGPTGSAKTSLVRYLAFLTANNFVRVNLDPQSDTSELIGCYVPVEGQAGMFRWHDGALVSALKQGHWILLDELNLADPEILERINSLLDDEGSLVISEGTGEKIMSPGAYRAKVRDYMERLRTVTVDDAGLRRLAERTLAQEGIFAVHPNFRLVTAMNPERYAGRNRLSLAMRNKLSEVWVSGALPVEELEQIVHAYLPELPATRAVARTMVALPGDHDPGLAGGRHDRCLSVQHAGAQGVGALRADLWSGAGMGHGACQRGRLSLLRPHEHVIRSTASRGGHARADRWGGPDAADAGCAGAGRAGARGGWRAVRARARRRARGIPPWSGGSSCPSARWRRWCGRTPQWKTSRRSPRPSRSTTRCC